MILKSLLGKVFREICKPRVTPLVWAAPLSSKCCDPCGKYPIGCSALVTGSAKGIGLEFVKHLLKCGVVNVMMSDCDADVGECEAANLRKHYPRSCLCFVKCDVTQCHEIKRLFKTAMELFGSLDIVVNNAGIFAECVWESMIDINLRSIVWGTYMAIECMSIERCGQGGAVINVSSIMGMQAMAGAPVYTASKHAVIGFTRSLAMPYHFCRTGVRAMALLPGVTKTVLIANAMKDTSPLGTESIKELCALPSQDKCIVGECLIEMIINGDTGTMWVSEGDENYEVLIPDRRTLRKK